MSDQNPLYILTHILGTDTITSHDACSYSVDALKAYVASIGSKVEWYAIDTDDIGIVWRAKSRFGTWCIDLIRVLE